MVRNYNAKKVLEFVLMATLVLTSMSFSVMEDAITTSGCYHSRRRIGTTAGHTANELMADITKADDTNLRVYSSDGTLLNGTDIVVDNSMLAAAAYNDAGMHNIKLTGTICKSSLLYYVSEFVK